jgi:predicted DNA binding CopG/RHH family protein
MKKRRPTYEERIADDYEKGRFQSVRPSKTDLKRFREAARATFIQDRRITVRVSSSDLMDIQTRAAEEGVPYQTLVGIVLHKFVTGRLKEKGSRTSPRSGGRARRRHAA